MRRTAERAVVLALMTLIGGGVLLTACTGGSTGASQPVAQSTPQAAATSPPSPTVEPVATIAVEQPTPAPSPTVAVYWPEQVEIPSIQVKGPVVQVGLEPDGTMEAPKGPDVIGWYTGSVAPGVAGNTLITAHVDWLNRETGKPQEAVFWNLRKVQSGDQVVVRSENDQTYTYVVKESFLVGFDDTEALKYVQPTTEPIMTLITCEGDFDQNTRNYSKRRIVIAELQT